MTVDPNTPHDTLVKELLGSPGDAAALLQTVLPGGVGAAIDWASLQRDDTELLAKHDASTHTDLLFRALAHVGEEHHEVMVLVVIEHQSTDDWTMPLRMLETMVGLWRRWLRQHRQARSIPLLARDREQAELLLVYLTLTTKLTGPVLAAMLSTQGAPRAASTMSTLHEMWEAQIREQWEAQQRERVFAEGKREGEREGEREGKRKTLVKLLTLKFGDLGEPDLRRIEQADGAGLETYLERVLTADSIAAVLGPG